MFSTSENSTNTLSIINSNTLYLVGGVLLISFCGFIAYKWYFSSPSSPSITTSSNLSLDSHSDITEFEVNSFNDTNTLLELLNTELDNSPLPEYPNFLNQIPQLSLEDFDMDNISPYLQNLDFQLSDFQIDLLFEMIFACDILSYDNKFLMVSLYLTNMIHLLTFLNNHLIVKYFLCYDFNSLINIQLFLRNLFSIHNAIKAIALSNCHSFEEIQEISQRFELIEYYLALCLHKILIILSLDYN